MASRQKACASSCPALVLLGAFVSTQIPKLREPAKNGTGRIIRLAEGPVFSRVARLVHKSMGRTGPVLKTFAFCPAPLVILEVSDASAYHSA